MSTPLVAATEKFYQYFGLDRDPFAPTSDPYFFYFTTQFERCIYGLKRSIDSRYGIVLVYGNYGTGKTSLMRHLFLHISRRNQLYNTALVSSPSPLWSSLELMQTILDQFNIPAPVKETHLASQNAFNQYLAQNRHRINTLIIDDAQNLGKAEHLEALRLLQNLETPHHKLLNLVMFGQMDLIPAIKERPNFEQRVNNAYVLKPLTYEDTCKMVAYRLQKAGMQEDKSIFEEACLKAIYDASGGIPREIVTVCRNALVLAGRIQQPVIQESIIHYVINNLTPKGVQAL